MTSEPIRTIDAAAGIVYTEPINTSREERTAHLSTRGDTLTTSTELSKLTHDTCAGIRNTLHSVTNTSIFAAHIHTSVGHTLSFPASVGRVGTIDPVTWISAERGLFVTELAWRTAHTYTGW